MKSLAFGVLAIALLTVFLLNPARTTLAQTGPAMPPGVSEESWIPLSDRSGILITRSGSDTNDPQGRVIVEIDGQWTDIDLVNRRGAFRELNREIPER